MFNHILGIQAQAAVVGIGVDNTASTGSNYVNSAEIEQVAEQENECELAGCFNEIGAQIQTVQVTLINEGNEEYSKKKKKKKKK